MTRAVRTSPSRQRGVALITAILIVALVAIVAASLGLGQQIWLRQAQNLRDRAQAEALRRGAIDFASVILERDAAQGNTDNLNEIWAQKLPPLPSDVGVIGLSISDAQSRFNLNSLLRTGAPSATDIGMFQRLLQAQGLDPALTEAVRDWIDTDNQVSPGGAEDNDYLALPHPYRTANQPMQSVDELRLVRGFTPESVEKLRPFLAALPEATNINVNTAPEGVLTALIPNVADSLVKQFVTMRQSQPLTDTGQLQTLLPSGTSVPANVSVNTSYFLVTTDIRVGRLTRRSEALLHRINGGKGTEVVWERQLYAEPIAENENAK
jgi:general secretion pathway protein K